MGMQDCAVGQLVSLGMATSQKKNDVQKLRHVPRRPVRPVRPQCP